MNTFLRKITSRKLWAAIAGVVVGLASIFGVDASEYAQVAGVIGAIASCVAYIIGEAKVDAANAYGYKEYHYELPGTETVTGDTSLIGTQDPEMGDVE